MSILTTVVTTYTEHQYPTPSHLQVLPIISLLSYHTNHNPTHPRQDRTHSSKLSLNRTMIPLSYIHTTCSSGANNLSIPKPALRLAFGNISLLLEFGFGVGFVVFVLHCDLVDKMPLWLCGSHWRRRHLCTFGF